MFWFRLVGGHVTEQFAADYLSRSGTGDGAGRLLIMGSKSTRENSSIKIQKILMIVNSWSQIKPKMSNSQSR